MCVWWLNKDLIKNSQFASFTKSYILPRNPFCIKILNQTVPIYSGISAELSHDMSGVNNYQLTNALTTTLPPTHPSSHLPREHPRDETFWNCFNHVVVDDRQIYNKELQLLDLELINTNAIFGSFQ